MPAPIRTIPIPRRTALAEVPPVLQDVKLKEHNLEGLDSTDLWELTRKCHLFRSIDLSGWKGVSVLSFRSLCLAVGASLQTVSLTFMVVIRHIWGPHTTTKTSISAVSLISRARSNQSTSSILLQARCETPCRVPSVSLLPSLVRISRTTSYSYVPVSRVFMHQL